MTAYALAHLHDPNLHPQVIDYIEQIQATLDPFGGRFLVHGPTVEVREGEWPVRTAAGDGVRDGVR
jgi:uncharacterized protein (DUF1330 family)